MTFSYDASEATDLDRVRGMVGDTSSTNPPAMLANETITAILTRKGDVVEAAIECIDRILALKARNGDRSGPGIQSQRQQAFTNYSELRDYLTEQRNASATGVAGGLSDAEVTAIEADTDFILPAFGARSIERVRGGSDEEW